MQYKQRVFKKQDCAALFKKSKKAFPKINGHGANKEKRSERKAARSNQFFELPINLGKSPVGRGDYVLIGEGNYVNFGCCVFDFHN